LGLAAWYENFHQNDPVLKNYPFGDYMGYLLNVGLIRSIETEQGRKYMITDLGTDFLNYIEKSGYSKFKQH
jgi:predicted transcriptional regulator